MNETEFLPDILEQIGRHPREFGPVHVHVDPVVRTASGTALATVWLQAAFNQIADAKVRVLSASDGRELATSALPKLDDGRVVRWTLPLQLVEPVSEVIVKVDAQVVEGSERIRAPWKLFDTLELARVENVDTGAASIAIAGALAAVKLALPTADSTGCARPHCQARR